MWPSRSSKCATFTFDQTEAYRQGTAILAFIVVFLIFLGGYYSWQFDGWWMVFFVLLLDWRLYQWLTSLGAKIKFYEKIIIAIVLMIAALLFIGLFAFGYAMAPARAWWAGLPLFLIYVFLARFVHKPRKKLLKKKE